MMDERDRIARKIESFRPYTDESMRNLQRAKVPIKLDINWSRCFVSYKKDNIDTVFNTKQDIVLKVSNIRFYKQSVRKANMNFVKPIKTLIDNRELQPLMLFINGTFIKWSNITVVHEYNTIYFLIKNISTFIKANPSITDVQVLSLPFKVYYSEIGSMSVDDIWYPFVFNEAGLLTSTHSAVFTYIGTTDDLLNSLGVYEETECNCKPLGISNTIKIYPENIIVFNKDGKILNVPVEIDRNIMTINNGTIGNYKYMILYKANEIQSLDNINRIVDDSENDIIASLAENMKSGTAMKDWEEDIVQPFLDPLKMIIEPHNLSIDDDKWYSRYAGALKYSMEYNPHFYDSLYKEDNRIKSEFYYGAEMIDAKNDQGYFIMPRRHTGDRDCYVMVFVNGILYKYTSMIKYEANKVLIPTLGLVASDTIEILFFNNVENKVLTGSIDINEDKTFLDKDLFNDNLVIFLNGSPDPETTEYNYPSYGKQVFRIDHIMEDMGNNETRIRFDETGDYIYPYNKPLTFASWNQFRSNSFISPIGERSVWTINSSNMNNGRYSHSATGTATSVMVQGGYTSITNNNTESYNGSVWTTNTSLLNSIRAYHSATGTATNVMMQGGNNNSTSINTTESYNGSVWTTNTSLMNTNRYLHSATGTATSCMVQGGNNGITNNNTESYNGSVWSNNTSLLNNIRSGHSATGTATSVMVQGGWDGSITNTSESYNGSVWTTNTSLMNNVRSSHSATGTATSCMVQGGSSIINTFNNTESYIGSTGQFRFNLSDDFRFCTDKYRYLVFVNGRLVDYTLYELTLYDPKVPYDVQFIYLRNELYKGENLDVFYVPVDLGSRFNNIVPNDGILYIFNGIPRFATENLPVYPFTSDMFMIFVNGKKIPAYIKTSKTRKAINQVQYDTSRISISQDPKSKLNLNIFAFNPYIRELAYVFDDTTHIFDTFVSKAEADDAVKLHSMIGANPLTKITNNEPDINIASISREIIYREIIRDNFTADRGVQQTHGFSENFEDREEIYPIENNFQEGISYATDATKEDNIDIDRTYTFEEIPNPKDRPLKPALPPEE